MEKTEEINNLIIKKDENLKVEEEKSKILKIKTIEILEENKNEIKNYFEKFQIENEPNNIANLNKDRPIIKKIYPEKNRYNLYIEIFNFPAFFRFEKNGLFPIISEISFYFEMFYNKYSNIKKDEFNKKFNQFFKGLLELNSDSIKDLLKIDITKNDLLRLKFGMEKLIDYFGIENINYFFLKFTSIGGGALLGGIIGLVFGLCTSVPILAPVGIGIGIGVIVGVVGYFIWKHFSNKEQEKIIERNQKPIKKFFYQILYDNSKIIDELLYLNNNLFIISFQKDKNKNIDDVILFPHYNNQLNSQNCPTIGPNETADSNSYYYSCLIKGIEHYKEKYATKINNYLLGNPEPNLMNELKKDIEELKIADEKKIMEIISKKENKTTPQANTSNCSTNLNYSGFPNVPTNYDFSEQGIKEPPKSENRNVLGISL